MRIFVSFVQLTFTVFAIGTMLVALKWYQKDESSLYPTPVQHCYRTASTLDNAYNRTPGEHTHAIADQTIRNERQEFVDEYFEPTMDTFRRPEFYKRKTEFRSGPIPKLFLYSIRPMHSPYWKESFSHIHNQECPLPCTLTEKRDEIESADAILLELYSLENLVLLEETIPVRDPHQPWIAHSTECPVPLHFKNIPLESMNGLFNRTSYFRRDSDIVWTHGFVVSREDAEYLPPSWHSEPSPSSFQPKPFSERKMAAAFISNCDAASNRLAYIEELSKYITVDIYGKCGNFSCGESRIMKSRMRVETDECTHEVAENYLFYLSFENTLAEDYATEKIYNNIYYPMVPVVLGGADYTKLLPANSYVNALQFSPEDLAKHLYELASNEEKYKAKLAWRQHYVASTVANRRVYCQLCAKLYDPEFYDHKVYGNFYSWFVTETNPNRKWVARKNVTTYEEPLI